MRPLSLTVAFVVAVTLLWPSAGWAKREFTGENDIGVEPELMKRVQDGLEMIYQRDYQGALKLFRETGEIYPDSPVGPFGRSVVYQAMMLENFDYEYADVYRVEADQALALVEQSRRSNQQKGWNWFLYAGIIGLEGLDKVRGGDFLTAFNKGWDALEAMKKAKKFEPTFADPDLGLGIYNYWRTAITDQVDFLPRFGDHRAEGIEQMERARDGGLLVWAGASYALAYTYMEERKYDEAIAECLMLQQDYPDSIINNMLLGRIYQKSKDYDNAIATYQKILDTDPNNRRVLWHMGDCYYKTRKNNDKAKEYFQRYLETSIPDMYRCHTHYRLGQIAERERDYAQAVREYTAALQADSSYKPAQKRYESAIKKRDKDPAAKNETD